MLEIAVRVIVAGSGVRCAYPRSRAWVGSNETVVSRARAQIEVLESVFESCGGDGAIEVDGTI